MTSVSKNTQCWVVTEGMAGTENQCLGVAARLGLEPRIVRIALKPPWSWFSPYLKCEQNFSFSPKLPPPWPDLLITSGRKSIGVSRYIRKMSGGKTFTVHIQDPRIAPENFDLVAVPHHDRTRGPNVVVTTAAPNRITAEKLEGARRNFLPLSELRQPRLAVLIGGKSKAYDLPPPRMSLLIDRLNTLDAGLMVTASRRTGEENLILLRQNLRKDNCYLWDGNGENPYFAMLGWADAIAVTADSVSMLSDAGTTGKPVYIIPMEGGSKRFEKFHAHLMEKGVARRFDGTLESWRYDPLDDAGLIAEAIRKGMASKTDN